MFIAGTTQTMGKDLVAVDPSAKTVNHFFVGLVENPFISKKKGLKIQPNSSQEDSIQVLLDQKYLSRLKASLFGKWSRTEILLVPGRNPKRACYHGLLGSICSLGVAALHGFTEAHHMRPNLCQRTTKSRPDPETRTRFLDGTSPKPHRCCVRLPF